MSTDFVQGTPILGPDKSKCDFCDCFLNGDSELSEHIASDGHIINRNSFIQYQIKQNNASKKKNIPLSLIQTLNVLRLKSPDSVKDLADNEFFNLTSDEEAKIANSFSKYLLKAFVTYSTKHMSQNFVDAIMKVLQECNKDSDDYDESEVEEDVSPGASNEQSPTHPNVSESPIEPKKEPEEIVREPEVPTTTHSASDIPSTEPNPESTYIPKLATIIVKLEPKD